MIALIDDILQDAYFSCLFSGLFGPMPPNLFAGPLEVHPARLDPDPRVCPARSAFRPFADQTRQAYKSREEAAGLGFFLRRQIPHTPRPALQGTSPCCCRADRPVATFQ